MLNVTPLLSINSSIQTSWGPGLWPCTPPVSLPEAGKACLIAQPPHLATGPSHMHKHTHTQNQKPAHNIGHTHTRKDAHMSVCMHAAEYEFTKGVRAHLLKDELGSHVHAPARHPARPSCHWKIVLHSTEGVMGCYQQDHSMDGCPN